jgi:hypothetical protein
MTKQARPRVLPAAAPAGIATQAERGKPGHRQAGLARTGRVRPERMAAARLTGKGLEPAAAFRQGWDG